MFTLDICFVLLYEVWNSVIRGKVRHMTVDISIIKEREESTKEQSTKYSIDDVVMTATMTIR